MDREAFREVISRPERSAFLARRERCVAEERSMVHQVVSGIIRELCGVLMSNKYWQALAELRNKSAHELKEVGDQWRTPDLLLGH